MLSAQNKFYIILSSYVKELVKKKFKFKFHGWFPGLQNLAVLFGKFTCGASFESFPGRTNSLKPPVF